MQLKRALWVGALTVGGLVLMGLPLRADDAPKPSAGDKPPWQRLLQGEDARQAKELEERLERLRETGKLREALQAAEALTELRRRRQGADHWQAVDARWQADALQRVLSQGKEAQAQFGRSFVLAREAADLEDRGRHQQAQPLREKVLGICRRLLGEEHPDTATAYSNLAANQHAQGKHAEAERGLRQALAIRRKALGAEHPDTAGAYNNLAANQQAQGKYAEAERGYRQALAIWRQALGEEHPDTATAYGNLGFNLYAQGKYAEAEQGLRKALAIRRQALGEEHRHTAAAYNNLALNQDAQGKYAEAEQGLRMALAICRKVLGEAHPDTAIAYNNLAENHHLQGKYAEAEVSLRKSLAIRRQALGEEHPSTAIAYNNLAANQYAQGRYAEAEVGCRKALAIWRQALGEEHPHTANAYKNLADNQHAQGQYAEADVGYRKALAIWRQTLGEGHPRTAVAYSNLASNQKAQGKYAEAEVSLRKVLAICRQALGEEHPDTATAYASLADLQNAQGKYAEAEEGYGKALAIYRQALGEEHHDTATAYGNLAYNRNAQGKYAEAEALWLQAAACFAKARPRFAPSGLGRAALTGTNPSLSWLAAVLARNGKPEDAWQRFEERLGRGTWDDLSARLRRPPAEQARQAELSNRLDRLDQLIERAFAVKDPTPEQKRRSEDLLAQRRKAQDELDAFARRLEQLYGPAAGQVFDRAAIQAALPADTALLGWLDLPGRPQAADPNGEHWAILLRHTGPAIWVRLRGSGPEGAWVEDDDRLPAALRTALQAPRGDWRPLADKLRRQRLEPLAKHLVAGRDLPAVRHLIVVESTALAGVPVEVIADGYTVSYAPSGTLFAHLRRQPRLETHGLLALADPVFDRPKVQRQSSPPAGGDEDKWEQLPGTRAEVEALKRLFAGTEPPPRLLFDSDASEQRLDELAQGGELAKYRYVHLATHGVVDDRFPLRSAVILARDALPDPQQQLDAGLPVYDARLTAAKVLRRWNLHAELVTLSACETALGKYERGEGFMGFAQALLLAGSRSVCLSQWKVDDAATALLMARFYQNLLGQRDGLKAPMRKAEALAEAKAWLRRLPRDEAVEQAAQLMQGVARGKGRPVLPLLPAVPVAPAGGKDDCPYAHPYYWAAFVLIGDPD
jgi:CHAT domain-containing protein/tetratricopeptide (TPR) repeat protein